LHCSSPRELREVIIDSCRTSREKGLQSSSSELSEVIIDCSGTSREIGLHYSPSEILIEASGTSREKGLHYSPRELSHVIITVPKEGDSAPEAEKRELA
jgi:hypothetical protein